MTARLAAIVGIWVWTLSVGVADFERVRVALPIEASPQAIEQTVDLADTARIESARLLLTIGVANLSPGQALTIATDAAGAAALTVVPSGEGQLQVVIDNPRDQSSRLRLHANHAEWRLTSLVASNARGFSRGVVSFAVVPRDQNIGHAPLWTWLLSAVVALVILRKEESESRTRWRIALLVGGWISVVMCLATAVSGIVSPFQVVLEPRSYILGLVLCCAGFGLPSSAVRAVPQITGTTSVVRIAVGSAGLIFFSAVMLQDLARYDGNYSGFLHVTHQVAERSPFLRERPDLRDSLVLHEHGYDAQFMYLIAFDPLLQRYADEPARYREVVDYPPYRFARIGYSALTHLFSAGQPERFPATMLWLVLAGHLLLGFGLVGMTMRAGAPLWLAATYLAIPGYLASLTLGLPEALAGAGLTLGAYWLLSGRSGLAAAGFAASLLVRETSLFLVIAALCSLGDFSRKQRIRSLVCALAPVAGWRMFVGARLQSDWGWMAFLPSPGDFVLPFTGFAEVLSAVLRGAYPQSEAGAVIVYQAVLVLGGLVALMALVRTRSAIAAATGAYAAIAVCLNYEKIWMHVPSGERGTIELFLGLLLLAILHYQNDPVLSRRILWVWVPLGLYTFLVSPEAGLARAGLLLVR